SSDYYDDLKLDNSILKAQTDSYRRIRNTFRYLIGNLNGFEENEKLPLDDFPELEKYILHRLWEINQTVEECVNTFNFHLMFTTLLNFCSNDLSAFYFDIRKDTIYCDSFQSTKRRASRTLLDLIFNHLVRWLAPSLAFTCEEAWQARGHTSSIHLEDFIPAKKEYQSTDLQKKWDMIKNVRKVITGALEKKRAEKIIGSSLEAHIKVYVSDEIKKIIAKIHLDEIAITSSYV
ncbi:MAG TPA: isoleucine--tRNA ligase, partial [Pelagibacterales bacterium]|nr:isoleucine--tRNA ligase [Pelagibacterales bacterium]